MKKNRQSYMISEEVSNWKISPVIERNYIWKGHSIHIYQPNEVLDVISEHSMSIGLNIRRAGY
jgi:hypothetical protein